MNILKRIALTLVLLVAAAPLVGLLYQTIMTQVDDSNYPAPGAFVEANGARLHVVCEGEGMPVVLMETGLGGDATWTWKRIAHKLSANNKICYYDRAGYGWSSTSNTVRSVQSLAVDLAAVADYVAPNSKLVLAGHSFGGPIIRAYTKKHAERVAGLVFVDSAHEEQGARLSAAAGVTETDWTRLAYEYGAPVGWVRLTRSRDLPKADTIDQDDYERLIAHTSQNKFVRSYLAESDTWIVDRVAPEFDYDFGDTPLFVISQDTNLNVPDEEKADYAVWAELQQELVELSRDSEFRMPEGAPHGIPYEMPEEVINAVNNVLRKSKMKAATEGAG